MIAVAAAVAVALAAAAVAAAVGETRCVTATRLAKNRGGMRMPLL